MEPQQQFNPGFQPQAIAPEPISKQKTSHKGLIISIIVVILIAALTGSATWYLMNKEITDAKAANTAQVNALQAKYDTLDKKYSAIAETMTLTNDQIFEDVASQLDLSRSELSYFRIFGQDKVSYSGNTLGSVPMTAYKQSGTWHSVVLGQGLTECSEYSSVPEEYKPICSITTSGNTEIVYMNSGRSSVNYPVSSMVSYIGE